VRKGITFHPVSRMEEVLEFAFPPLKGKAAKTVKIEHEVKPVKAVKLAKATKPAKAAKPAKGAKSATVVKSAGTRIARKRGRPPKVK